MDENCTLIKMMTALFCRSISYNFSSRFLSICEAAECGGRCSKYCWWLQPVEETSGDSEWICSWDIQVSVLLCLE